MSTQTKEATKATCLWAQIACTHMHKYPHYSCIFTNTTTMPKDTDTVCWAAHHLQTYLPIKTPSPNQQQHPNQLPALTWPLPNTKHTDSSKKTPKELPDGLHCNLLGLSSIAWSDRHLLQLLWQEIYQATNKASRYIVLWTFFQNLGNQVPSC